MAIVIRKSGGKWQKATKVEFVAETQLQKLLYDSPELIPTYDDEPAVFIREAGLPGSGSTDLLGVDASGNILIVETKLARNHEVRRTVIGQVLEYAAYLWNMSFVNFDLLFTRRAGAPVLDLLQAKNPDIVRDEVHDAIAQKLSGGAFELFIAVDQMNEELETIIGYVSSRGSGLKLEVLEFDLHQSGEMEIIVPRRHGQIATTDRTRSSTRPMRTVEEIIASIADEKQKRVFNLLIKEWQDAGHMVKPGTKGASFQARVGEDYRPIFWAYPGRLQNAFGDFPSYGMPEELAERYRKAVANLPGFNREDVLSKRQPVTKVDGVSEETLRTFLSISNHLVNDWRSTLTLQQT